MKVLVTGGGGFLGLAICKQLLAHGHTVRTLNRQAYPTLSAMDVDQRLGDIRILDIVIDAALGVDAIIHSAAKAGAWGPFEEFYEINVRGTDNVLAACDMQSITKLVYTSSPSVVHNGQDLNGVNESTPYAKRFLAAYPETKALAEQRVLAANGPALATVALRPHLIWGPNDPHLLPRILKRLKSGRLRLIGDQQKKIDAVYVDNAAQAHILALEKLEPNAACAGKSYFITQGDPITIEAMINALLRAAGYPPETRRISLGLARFLATTLESIYTVLNIKTEPPLTRFIVEQLSTAHWFNIDAARRDLGYAPHVSMSEGMARLSAWLARERLAQKTH